MTEAGEFTNLLLTLLFPKSSSLQCSLADEMSHITEYLKMANTKRATLSFHNFLTSTKWMHNTAGYIFVNGCLQGRKWIENLCNNVKNTLFIYSWNQTIQNHPVWSLDSDKWMMPQKPVSHLFLLFKQFWIMWQPQRFFVFIFMATMWITPTTQVLQISCFTP